MKLFPIDCQDCAETDANHKRPHPQGRRHARQDGTCESCGGRAWTPAGGMSVMDRMRVRREVA